MFTLPPAAERSILMSVSVCLFVCWRLSLSLSEPHTLTSPSFLCVSTIVVTVVARSSSGGVAMDFVEDANFSDNRPGKGG